MASTVQPKNSVPNPPDTEVRTTHSIQIWFNDRVIGLINSWNVQSSKQVTPIYELNKETSGLPYENVPGNVQNLTMNVQRYDLWTQRMEDVIGGPNPLDMLSSQKSPFQVKETWERPDGTVEAWEYQGCWFESIGRNFSSSDQRVVNVNATIRFLYKHRIQ